MATMTVNYIELNVALLNINGLRNKKDEIQDIMTAHQVDVLALCETKLEPSFEDSKVQIPGFKLWRKDRNSNGGGVALYTDDHMEAELGEDLMFDKVEIIWVELKLADRQSVLVGSCYRPPSNCYKPPLKAGTYLDQIIENIKTVSKKGKPILLMGDFNIDWLKDSSDKRKITSVLSECNINQIVSEATRDAKNISKCIDHVYTNMLHSGVIVSEGCSDHKLITFTARLKKVIHHRSDNMLNYESFISDIKKAQWTEVYEEIYPKEALLKFKDIFFSIVNKHAPREIQVTSDSTMSEPGIQRKTPENYPGPSREFDDNSLEKLKAENDPETLLKILREIQGERLPPRLNHFNTNRFQTNRLDSVLYAYRGKKNSFRFRRAEPETVETLLECLHLPVLNNTDESEVKLIRLAAKQISDPIYYILNRCIESVEGNHRGQSSEMDKRPDSVDAVLSHIFDVVLFKQTKQYFTEQSNQPSASLGNVLQEIHRKCLRDALDNKPVRLLFLDFYPLLHNHRFISKLQSRGFTENAIFLMKTYFSNHRKSICLPRRGFLAGFLFRFILDGFKMRKQLFAVCENHMIIYNNPQKNLQEEIETLNKQLKQHDVYINESRIFEINTLRDTLMIFEMLEFVLRSHRDQLNWIKVFKTIVENYRLFNEEFKNILENLDQYFARGSLETCEGFKKSVMNLLVLSHLEN